MKSNFRKLGLYYWTRVLDFMNQLKTDFLNLFITFIRSRQMGLSLFTLETCLLICFIMTFYANVSKEKFDKALYECHFPDSNEQAYSKYIKGEHSTFETYSESTRTEHARAYHILSKNLELLNTENHVWQPENLMRIFRQYEKDPKNFSSYLKKVDAPRSLVRDLFTNPKRFLLLNGLASERDFTLDSQIIAMNKKKNKEADYMNGIPLVYLDSNKGYYFIVGETDLEVYEPDPRKDLNEYLILDLKDDKGVTKRLILIPIQTRIMREERQKTIGLTEEVKKQILLQQSKNYK